MNHFIEINGIKPSEKVPMGQEAHGRVGLPQFLGKIFTGLQENQTSLVFFSSSSIR
jgi:hypothetical protein